MGLLAIPFVTLPSLVYGVVHFMLGLLVGFSIRPFVGGLRAGIVSDAICAKFLTPVTLLVVLPLAFYFFVSVPLAWAFFGWLLLYFILRRLSGVSAWHQQYTRSLTEADRIARDLQKKTGQKL